MEIDKRTSEYFQGIKQVFLYISDQCNLLCEQCLYKPNVLIGKSISCDLAKKLLTVFRSLGAFKLSILGGEVSLYDISNDNAALIEVLDYATKSGFSYIRIDTNGQSNHSFFREEIMKYIDEVSFSIDGYDNKTNDILRGAGTFDKSIANLSIAREKGINAHITACVTKQNTAIAGGILPFIENMISFCIDYDISNLNLHGVFKMGVPMDLWTGDSHIDPADWYAVTEIVLNRVKSGYYPINLRFPMHVVDESEYNRNPKYYSYCPCKLGERALIHPDGIIRVCSSMLSTPYGVANFNDEKIIWNEYNNELCNHKMAEMTPCTNQREMYSSSLKPVCFSIKPFQNEPVWNTLRPEHEMLLT